MKIRCMNCMVEYDSELECCPECGFVKGTSPKEIYHLYPEVVLAERYIVGTVIAYGGFGVLYRAWDQKLQIMVAIKEYFPSGYVNRNPGETEIFIYTSKKQGEFQRGLDGFLEEARNTAKFSSHPNIVNVYDYFRENKTAYMVMEYMDGVTLKEYTKQTGGRIDWKRAVEILSSICDDLQVVHEAGVLHRDISPDNIMLCKDGTIKLFDFGAAHFANAEKELTRDITLKIGFAPPEQYRAKSKQGAWTDVYALGATLYRTITGMLPDESENRREAIRQKKKDTLIKPKTLETEIPDYLDRAICKAMAIQPELRFKNVKQFKDALLNKKPCIDIEEELKVRKKRRKIGICAILLGLLIGGTGCFRYYLERQNETSLKNVAVSIWIPVAEDETEDEKRSLLDSMLTEFRTDYPEVDIQVTCIQELNYEERLQQAKEQVEGFPTLYESGHLNQELLEYSADLSDVLQLINADEYYFLNQVSLTGAGLRKLPLGMHIAIVYKNPQLVNANQVLGMQNNKSSFLNGQTSVWIADTRNYTEVQSMLPGIYEMLPLSAEKLVIGFDNEWSVDRQAAKLEQTAAKRILYYFLGETAQDVLHLQNDSNLPLNKNEFMIYLDVNQEFDFLEQQVNAGIEMEFLENQDYQDALDSYYTELITDNQITDELERLKSGGAE